MIKKILVPSEVIMNNSNEGLATTVYIFLLLHKNFQEEIIFSKKTLYQFSGLKAYTANAKRKEYIDNIIENTFIHLWRYQSDIEDYRKASLNKMIILRTSDHFFKHDSNSPYALLDLDKVLKINSYIIDKSIFNPAPVYRFYAYFKMKMYKPKNDGYDYMPAIFYALHKNITDDLNMKTEVIEKTLQKLEEIEIIKYQRLYRTKLGDKWRTNPVVISDFNQQILDDGVKYVTKLIKKEALFNKLDQKNKIKGEN